MEIIFDFSDNSNQSPNWFDWLSLAVSVLSIIIAYLWGQYIYKKEKEDRQDEETKNIESEKELFNENISILRNDIEKQIESLNNYIDQKDFVIKLNPNIKIDFLKFINIKSLYKDNNRNKVNTLLSALYSISDFYIFLTRERDEHQKHYKDDERVFQENYREVFYTQNYLLHNKRIEEVIEENGKINIAYHKDDKFMPEFQKIVNDFEKNITNENGTADRDKIMEELKKIMTITVQYIPFDYDAIMVNIIANKASAAYINMKNRKDVHFRTIKSLITTLESVNNAIDNYNNKN